MTKCKYDLKPWLVKKWCIPKAGADFVASMYDVSEVYQHPNDSLRPVICIDETNKQLIKEKRVQCEYGCSEKVDLVYMQQSFGCVYDFRTSCRQA